MNTITVATFNRREDAEPLRQHFEESGVHAFVHDDSKWERLWLVSKPLAAVHLDVPEESYETARQQIKQWDAEEGILRNAVRCPECRSSRIEYPQMTRKSFHGNLVGLLSVLGLLEREYYCQDCHFTWPSKENNPPPHAQAHSAPDYFIDDVSGGRAAAQAEEEAAAEKSRARGEPAK